MAAIFAFPNGSYSTYSGGNGLKKVEYGLREDKISDSTATRGSPKGDGSLATVSTIILQPEGSVERPQNLADFSALL
ncbi:hypothetical protein TNCV_2281211 [Trichonephila clavipes]|nr:hypothetical protein TNCV_2281211 [Trichonephila clavipes]